jgi:hypothetical protein
MYILVYTEFNNDKKAIRFHVLYSSKNESDAEEYYNYLINNSEKKYSFLNLSMFYVSDGENDVVVGNCEY